MKQTMKRVLSLLMVISMLCGYIVLPASAADAFCGKDAHEHSEECYVTTVICGKEGEKGLICDKQTHAHDDSCKHFHNDACKELNCADTDKIVCGIEAGALVCEKTEKTCELSTEPVVTCTEAHEHTPECPADSHVHTEECEYKHSESCYHVHGDSCKHAHTAECFSIICGTEEGAIVCGKEEYAHTEECYKVHEHVEECYNTELTCEKEVHTHEDKCFPKDTVFNKNNISKEITAGTNGYTFMSAYGPAYEMSNHMVSANKGVNNSIPQTLIMVDASEDYTWTPSGKYVFGESNYEVMYCCDEHTGYEGGIHYKRTNLEDSTYYNEEAAAHIRAIITNSYPFVTLEQMKKNLAKEGFADADKLTRADIIAAVQVAVWNYANDAKELEYSQTFDVPTNTQWGTVLHDYTNDMYQWWKTGKRVFSKDEEVGNRINALVDHLTAQEEVYAEKNQIVISKLEIVDAAPVQENDGVYKLIIRIELNNSGSSTQDEINITVAANGEVIKTEPVALGTEVYDLAVEAAPNQELEIVVSGKQNLPAGVYFYSPEGGRDISQSLVGVAEGETDVYANATITFETETEITKTGTLKLQKINSKSQPITGAEFTLYVQGKDQTMMQVDTFAVDANGQLVIENLVPGSYELVETNVPYGYFTSEEKILFQIDEEGNLKAEENKTAYMLNGTLRVINFLPDEVPTEKPLDPVQLGSKTDELLERRENRYEVNVKVPGVDGDRGHDEVILMVDGSYSGDEEWPQMKDAIIEIGNNVLNGSGTTQLTMLAFGMGDNDVLVHVKDPNELAAALGNLPGSLLYGRSSTNCEAGFTGVINYIKNHDASLKNVQVVYISDGRVNTDETPRAFDANWKTWATQFGKLTVAQVGFEETLVYGTKLPAAFTTVFGDRFVGAAKEEILSRAFGGEVTDEEFIAFADQVWADVYAYSGLTPRAEYPVSVAERAFVKYDKENGTYIQDLFYYTTYKSSYVKYPNGTARAVAAAEALAAMDRVSAMYVVDTDAKSAWMDSSIKNVKSKFIQSSGLAGLYDALAEAIKEMAKYPFNDVVITDYMSKWVNLDKDTIKIIDDNTGATIWTVNGGWAEGVTPPTSAEPPVVVELVDSADYAAGGEDVIGNTSGDIYKLTWNVKDGAMLRSDNFTLSYEVLVDTNEEGFEYKKDYPANGNTDLHNKDENGEQKEYPIDVPTVNAEKQIIPEIVIHKVDTNGNALAGAKFALYAGENLIGEYEVDSTGKIPVKDLEPGVYKLVETKAPNGYIGVSEPMYFEIRFDAKADGFVVKHYFEEFEVNFPATAYEISNHSMYPAIPQTFVLLDGDKADSWSYPGEYSFGESNYRVVYCGDSNTGLKDGIRYVKTNLEDCFDAATANKLRAIVANSYPYVSVEDMIAAAAKAGVADAANLTRGDIIAAVQLAIWRYTNGVEEYTYRATYSVMDYPKWGKVYNDYSAELPEYLPTNTTATMQDTAGAARIDALYNYLINLAPEAAAASDVDVFFYTAVGGKDISQSLIGADKPGFYTDGLEIFVKNVKIPVEEPKEPIKITFKNGEASNISFMLIDKDGNVEFLKKIDIGSQTSFEIPSEPGKVSAVFVKQSTSGMFWFSEEVDEATVNATIACLKANNPSYKGYNAVAFGEGNHQLEFKKNKFVTYNFSGSTAVMPEVKTEVKPEVKPEAKPEVKPEAKPEVKPEQQPEVKPVFQYSVKGATAKSTAVVNGVSAIYIAKNGKIPAVIWTSEKVAASAHAALVEALGADADAEFVSGLGAVKVEYQQNKNKTKTVTYTFETVK